MNPTDSSSVWLDCAPCYLSSYFSSRNFILLKIPWVPSCLYHTFHRKDRDASKLDSTFASSYNLKSLNQTVFFSLFQHYSALLLLPLSFSSSSLSPSLSSSFIFLRTRFNFYYHTSMGDFLCLFLLLYFIEWPEVCMVSFLY